MAYCSRPSQGPPGSYSSGFSLAGIARLATAGETAAAAGRSRLTVALGGAARARVIIVLAGVLGLSSADVATVGASAIELRRALSISNTGLGLLVTVTSLAGAVASLPFGVLGLFQGSSPMGYSGDPPAAATACGRSWIGSHAIPCKLSRIFRTTPRGRPPPAGPPPASRQSLLRAAVSVCRFFMADGTFIVRLPGTGILLVNSAEPAMSALGGRPECRLAERCPFHPIYLNLALRYKGTEKDCAMFVRYTRTNIAQ